MAIPDRLENKAAIEAAKAEILAALTEQGNVIAGCVKSVQQGITRADGNNADTYLSLTISEIDPLKSIAIVTGFAPSKSGSSVVCFHSLEAEKLNVRCVGGTYIGWQVIEFY